MEATSASRTDEHEPATHRTPLSRERIVEAALHLMDAEGLEAVTMRRIGRELGVEAMSLYNHVEDKNDILDGICERVMAEFDFPEPATDWAESCRRGARSWRTLLKTHPDVMRLFAEARGPMRSPDSLRPMEYALRLLRASGLSDRDTAQAFHAFGGYIQGFVIMEMGSMAGGTDKTQLARHEEIAEALPGEFEFGLDLLIRGLLQRARAANG